MITLVLLRHAKAVAQDPDGDHSRSLNQRGRTAALTVGALLEDLDPAIDLALVSDATRTRQTADLVLTCLSKPPPLRFEPSLYGATPRGILSLIQTLDGGVKTVLVVGHNPGLGDLARQLSGTGDPDAIRRLRERFPTASAAIVDFDRLAWRDLRAKAGILRRFLTHDEGE